ncbi:PREDICTED: uncharacterized protein LOC109343762 isoform X1 [Lupinus angustifolius]|uniref:uncharacterized protein LOC109343762 isoform X1 n=1 Tax=Lupinus angustifolius TaxID=3871 RepID=UPI00092F1CFF|nr:PREDICTED: uncharacterized protein LOC109343762 isoform X1 [Lupinus angustifolius]
MLSYQQPLHFCLLLTFFLSHSSTSFSHQPSYSPTLLTKLTPGPSQNEGNALDFRPGRLLLDEIAAEPVPFENTVNSPVLFPLAAERTRRKDPLDGFNKYTHGWNISDHHYWASVAYTAVPLFSFAAVWFFGFGLSLLLIIICYCCRDRETYVHSRACYTVSLILLILFAFAAMIGCAVLYIGQGSFHHSTTTTLHYVVDQADSTVDKLRNVSDFLAQAKQVGIDRVFLPANVQSDIDEVETKINTSATTLADQTKENSNNIQDLLDSVKVALIIIAAVMLVLTFLGFLFSIFGIQLLVYILIIAGWVLVTGTFILCGLFLLLHNVTEDTCVAMGEWIQFPTANTALDDILPCVDNATAQETLLRSKEVTSELVNLVNQVITNVSNINFAPNFTPLYYNQSGPLMPLLCNPFHPDMTDRQCDAGEVGLSNATQVYGNFACQVSPSEICMTQGRLTPTFYNQISAAINSGDALYNYAPSLLDLLDCTFVRETFSDITRDHCPGLQRYSGWIYTGLLIVSFAVMFSLIFWIVYGREKRHRLYTEESKDLTLVTPAAAAPATPNALALAHIPEEYR